MKTKATSKTKRVYSQKSRSKEDNSSPFQRRRKLTPAEALRAVQLEHLLLSHSTDASEYIEMRASFAPSLGEKRAWRMILVLLKYIEGNLRFPRYKEQMHLFDALFQNQEYQFPQISLLHLVESKEQEKLIRDLRTRRKSK